MAPASWQDRKRSLTSDRNRHQPPSSDHPCPLELPQRSNPTPRAIDGKATLHRNMPAMPGGGRIGRLPHRSGVSFQPLKRAEGDTQSYPQTVRVGERTGQRGITEQPPLQECDNERLQRNEDHLARVLNGGLRLRSSPATTSSRSRDTTIGGSKTPYVSVLWRMSISKDPIFEEVSLGPLYEERISGSSSRRLEGRRG